MFPLCLQNGIVSCPRLIPRLFPFSAQIGTKSSDLEDRWRSIDSYKWFLPIQTRWKDNDQYGHVNNAVFQSYFDSVVNVFLIRFCRLDVQTNRSKAVAFIVENSCQFYQPIQFPNIPLVGLTINHLGNSSIRYQLGIFKPQSETDPPSGLNFCRGHRFGDEILSKFKGDALATGTFVHVTVDGQTNRPVPVPDNWRTQFRDILM